MTTSGKEEKKRVRRLTSSRVAHSNQGFSSCIIQQVVVRLPLKNHVGLPFLWSRVFKRARLRGVYPNQPPGDRS